MAADVGQQLTGWAYSDVPYNDHSTQDPSVQQMVLDHGSVSFGRFAAERLSWEKRSVFAHNSRQEELRKLTAPGLVAQKKAFFEEYYNKRARQLKVQGAMQQTETTQKEANDENTLGCSSQVQEEQLPAVVSDNLVATATSSSFEPSEGSSVDERKCQEAHNTGYLTFNPLFSQTAGPQNVQQEERSSSGEKQNLDLEVPCATNTNSIHGHIDEPLERRVLRPRRVVSNDNSENNVVGTRIVLPKASLQSQGLKVVCGEQGERKTAAPINRPMKRSKDVSTSVVHIPRVDVRRNSENRPSQDLKDPFHKRVEMKLRALSDRINADKAAASSRSASYQPSERAVTTSGSSYQSTDRIANSSRPILRQNTRRFLAPSKSAAAQGSHMSSSNSTATENLAAKIAVMANSSQVRAKTSNSQRSSSNSTATGNLAAKIPVMASSYQVRAKTSKSAQVTSEGVAGLTRVNNASQKKRKQWSVPAALEENNPKRGYVRKSMPQSARSSSESSLPTAKVPKIANRTNETKVKTTVVKSEYVQNLRSASHPVAGRNNMTKPTPNCNEQNRKVTSTRAGRLAGSSTRSNLTSGPSRTKNKTRQERPRWR